MEYKITRMYDSYYINEIHETYTNNYKIDESIFWKGLLEYQIIDREDEILNIIQWISESQNRVTRASMLEDLKQLMLMKDEYIYSSMDANKYISREDEEFNETTESILAINKEIKNEKN